MNKGEWEQLEEECAREFQSWSEVVKSGLKIRDYDRLTKLIVASLKYAGEIRRGRWKPKYRWGDSGTPAPFGPAPMLLANLPEAEILSAEDCANIYYNLLLGAVYSFAPAELFLGVVQYSNTLIPRFSHIRFRDPVAFDKIEVKLRRILLQQSVADLIIRDKNRNVLGDLYEQSLRRVADAYLRSGDYLGSVRSLTDEQTRHYPKKLSEDANVDYTRRYWAHYYNNLLGIFPPKDLLYGLPTRNLPPHQQVRVDELENPSIEGIEARDIELSLVDGTIDPKGYTRIVVVIPAELPEGEFETENWKVLTQRIDDPFQDPNFRMLHEQGTHLNGVPLALISPTLQKDTTCTLVCLETMSAFHPDFTVDPAGEPTKRDNTIAREVCGEDYDPYIAKVSEILIRSKLPLDDLVTGITSAIKEIDGFVVEYLNVDRIVTFHIFRPIGKVGKFISLRERFVNRFADAVKNGSRGERLRRLILQGPSGGDFALRKFTIELFNELIVRPSEHGDWWKTVWANKTYSEVRREPEVHRDMFHILRPWFEINGMAFDREISAAGGAVDFVVTEILEQIPHRCCVEVKYAHHQHVVDSVAKQLPAYMADLDAKVGVLLVLWCRGDAFSGPPGYQDISNLRQKLIASVPRGYDIFVQTVDAAFRAPPSKRRLAL